MIVEPNDPDFGLSDEDKKSIDEALAEGGEIMEREQSIDQQANMEPKKEREPAENSWTSIEMYYHGFHIKKSVPATISPEDLKKGIEEYEKLGFEPSWNPDTNKAVKGGVVQKTETVQNTPICGIHNVPMVERKGQYGMFYACPTKLEDGSWCKFKAPKK